MKLRNKKTGEIMPASNIAVVIGEDDKRYNSLAEFNEEWEDCEEPKEYWFIDEYGMVQQEIDYFYEENKSAIHDNRLKVGNYFENKEEAVTAVEKLKAYKRLKDKGFKFKDFYRLNDWNIAIRAASDKEWSKIYKDLNLLFGGKE